MGFNDGFSAQGVPFVTGSAGQALVWDDVTKSWVAGEGGLASVVTDGINITGSGTSGDPIELLPDITVTTLTASSDVYIGGNLTVSGTATYINTENVTIKDINIELATGNTSDAIANGAGITIKGSTDKTIIWKNDGTGFNFNQPITVPARISGSLLSIGENNLVFSPGSVAIGIGSSTGNAAYALAQGQSVLASNTAAHAEGINTTGSGLSAHAEGNSTIASGPFSHAEGISTKAIGQNSHAEGFASEARSEGSHAEGLYVIASASYQHAQGQYNQTSSTALMLVGNGTGLSNRSNILEVFTNNVNIRGALSSSNVTASVFTGSFIGDASGLTNLPGVETLSFDRILYVNSGGTGVSGSYADPFGTIQEALTYADTQYISGESVIINIGPGTYTAPSPITRKNTYFKAANGKYEQRAVTISGPVEVSCSYNAGDMFNKIVGFEGIFFSGGNNSSTFKVSTNSYTTYLKDCYIAASTGQNGLYLPSNLTTTFGNGSRVVANNCYFWRQTGNADLIFVEGGSCKFDSLEMGFGGAGSASAIKQTGGVIQVDRLLVDVATTVAAISSSVTPSLTPNLFLTNVSLVSSGSANAIINNGHVFIANSYLGNNVGSTPTINGTGIVTYGSLTSLGTQPVVINGSIKNPLPETFGNTRVNSISSSAGLTGSFVGNGSALTNLTASSWTTGRFSIDVRKELSGSGIISYDTSSGVISTNATFLTGVFTENNITGSGIESDKVRLKDNISIVNLTASNNVYVSNNLYVAGTASIGLLETVSQSSLQIGDKYIIILSGANDHTAVNGAAILWGSGSFDGTQGPEGSVAFIEYITGSEGEFLQIGPGAKISGSLKVISSVSASNYIGDGSGLINVTASAFPGIDDYAKKVDVSSSFAAFTGSNVFTGPNRFTQVITASAGVIGTFTGSLAGNASTATNADTLDTYHAEAFALTGSDNTFKGNNTFTGPVTASSGITGSFTGSFSGSITNADKLGGFDAITYARTGSNNFTAHNTFTTLSASQITASVFTGSFVGNGSQVINLTGSNWNGGTGSFFANVRDAFTTGSGITIGAADGSGRYQISSTGGTGGSSAGSVLTYPLAITGSFPALTPGTIVGVSGSAIRPANNADPLSSNIIGVVSGTVGPTSFNVVIAGEVSASISSSATMPSGGTPVYLSNDPGRFSTYDPILAGRNVVQVGIVGPRDNLIILQPRIFGVKA